jgi:hypothetical protein
MKDDLSSIFHKPEFKELLAKYADMLDIPVFILKPTKSPYWQNSMQAWEI